MSQLAPQGTRGGRLRGRDESGLLFLLPGKKGGEPTGGGGETEGRLREER